MKKTKIHFFAGGSGSPYSWAAAKFIENRKYQLKKGSV
jgi:hypothetical protein